jgi:putative ATPase
VTAPADPGTARSLFGEEPDDDGADDGVATPAASAAGAPLADRMRPARLEEVEGQEPVLGPGSLLRTAEETGEVPSLVLWGPPGSGKTTVARLLAARGGARFVALSAVTSGVKDVRAVIEQADRRRRRGGKTLLFVDEIHRFNKAQQDAFLPHVEAGTVVLVGATTENPSFALTSALLSRLRVVVLAPLSPDALSRVLARALADPRGLGGRLSIEDDARDLLLRVADGDARRMLNALESAAALADAAGRASVTFDDVREGAQTRYARYDRAGDAHYDALSAFHKSLRGSDVDATLYWMARMIEGGESPLVIVRRMVAMASEDVGLADSRALRIALDAKEAVEFLGVPEGELALVHAAIYLASAPKSNAVVEALGRAHEAAKETPSAPVPLHVRNAPTPLTKDLGHGRGYLYPHESPEAFERQEYLPPEVAGRTFYVPKEIGDERETARRVAYWRSLRAKGAGKAAPGDGGAEA